MTTQAQLVAFYVLCVVYRCARVINQLIAVDLLREISPPVIVLIRFAVFFSFARKLAYDADACSPDVLERVVCVLVCGILFAAALN